MLLTLATISLSTAQASELTIASLENAFVLLVNHGVWPQNLALTSHLAAQALMDAEDAQLSFPEPTGAL